jgi:hypothetical protein
LLIILVFLHVGWVMENQKFAWKLLLQNKDQVVRKEIAGFERLGGKVSKKRE